MKTSLPTLDALDVAEPCPERWDRMTGGHQARFCASCQKHVHNLSAMSREQAEAIVSEGECCVRFTRDRRGRTLTADWFLARLFPSLWAGFALMFLGGCKTKTMGMIPDYMEQAKGTLRNPQTGQPSPNSEASAPEAVAKPPSSPDILVPMKED